MASRMNFTDTGPPARTQIEAEAAKRCEEHGGLLFSRKEVEELADYASKWGVEGFDAESFKVVSVPE